jgi:hypothetical protein
VGLPQGTRDRLGRDLFVVPAVPAARLVAGAAGGKEA